MISIIFLLHNTRFTVVQTYSIFWSEITSEIVQESMHGIINIIMQNFITSSSLLFSDTNGYLLLANVETIKTMNLDGSSLQTLTYEPRNVIDADFHYRYIYNIYTHILLMLICSTICKYCKCTPTL